MESVKQSLPAVWLAIGHGEGGAEMRLVHSDSEMVDWLWDQCGASDHASEAEDRKTWADYVADEDNWQRLDDVPRWKTHIEVGETGHIEFIRLLDGPLALTQQRDELLAALKAFTAAANSWHNFHHGSTTIQCDLLCECIVAGEAAIAKAEGRGT